MKKSILFLFLLLSIEVAISGELIAHWDFNRLDGSRIVDKTGKYAISVGGELSENLLQPGLDGQAFYFYIGKNRLTLPHAEAFNLSNDFTIVFEMKADDVNGFRAILWKGERSVTPEAVSYAVDIRNGKVELKYKNRSGGWIVHQSEKVIDSGKWYHVIIYYNSGTCDIYVNGEKNRVQRSVEGNDPVEIIPNHYDCLVGRGQTARREAFFFSGLLDDLRIYRGRHIDIDDDYQEKRSELLQDYQRRLELHTARTLEADQEKSRKLSDEYRRFFRDRAGNGPFAAMLIPVSDRLVKKADFFQNPLLWQNGIFSLSAAGREFESAQLVILGNPEAKTRISGIQVSDLTSQDGKIIPSTNISVGRIGFINSEEPDIAVDFVGAFPDPVFLGETVLEIDAGGFGLACIRIDTAGASSGVYNGNVTVRTDSAELQVPFRIRIYDFELPVRSSLRAPFSFFEKFYQQWYGLKEVSLDRRLKIYDFLLQYRLSPGNIYAPSDGPSPSYDALDILKERINLFILQSWSGRALLPPEKLKAKIAAYSAEIEQARALGIDDRMYVYLFDEISNRPQTYPAAEQASSALKEAFPGIRLMQTSFPVEGIRDYFNVWVPLLDEFAKPERRHILNQLKSRGDEIWWYAADEPAKPFPNFFLDYPVYDCRIIGILSYMYDVSGLLYWSINREWRTNLDIRETWPEADWKPYIFHITYNTRKAKNGMGNLVYPGRNGELLPSLRLENLRDGLEDYEYLVLLKKTAAKLPENDPDRAAAAKLLEIPPAVARAINDYSADPQHLMKYREQVANMIEKLNQGIKK